MMNKYQALEFLELPKIATKSEEQMEKINQDSKYTFLFRLCIAKQPEQNDASKEIIKTNSDI